VLLPRSHHPFMIHPSFFPSHVWKLPNVACLGLSAMILLRTIHTLRQACFHRGPPSASERLSSKPSAPQLFRHDHPTAYLTLQPNLRYLTLQAFVAADVLLLLHG